MILIPLQTKSFMSYRITLSIFPYFWPYFRISVHISVILSIFSYFCPYLLTSVHISVLLSIFPYFCPYFRTSVHISVLLSIFPYFCQYFRTSVNISPKHILNRWTNTDETLHSCCVQPEDVHEGGPKNIKGDNSRVIIICVGHGVSVLFDSQF